MPIYEYQCQSCGRTLEKRQKFSDPELTVCPHCGGKLEKQISAPAVQFKGGGWYADGYGSSKGGSKPASSEGSSSSSDSGSSSSDSSSGSSAPTSTASTTPAAPAAPASSSTPTK